MTTKNTPTAAPLLVSQAELADWLGCSTRTCREYAERGIITATMKVGNRWVLKECVQAVTASLRETAMGRAGHTDGDDTINPGREAALLNRSKRQLTDLMKIKTQAQIRQAEAELALIEGRSIDAETIMAAWGGILTTAKGRLRAIPGAMAHTLGLTRKGIADLSDAIDEVLENLAEDGVAAHSETAERQRAAQAAAQTTKSTAAYSGDNHQ